jgi:hypothetical protein
MLNLFLYSPSPIVIRGRPYTGRDEVSVGLRMIP